MNKVRLIFKGISEISGSEDIGLLSLVDIHEQRQLVISCDKLMLNQFVMRMGAKPVAKGGLPEALWQMLSLQTDAAFELIIHNLVEGQYQVVLRNTMTNDTIPIKAGDAVLLSYITKVPLYIEETLMMRQSMVYDGNAKTVALPVNTVSDRMLKTALQKAIDEEKYELASHLRDEIRRRKEQKDEGR